MNRYILGLALVLGVALVAGYIRAADDDDEDARKARGAILDVTKDVEGGKDVNNKIDALRKKYEDLEHLMKVYKPREKGGLGIGPASKGDGIEFKIINLGKKKLAPGALSKEKAELLKMAYLNLAMSKITNKFVGKKKPKEWKSYSEDMEKASKELLEALKKDDPVAVQKSAFKLNASCTGCHSDIRDS